MTIIDGGVTSPKGFKAAGIHAGLKKAKKDMAMIISEKEAVTAATFTTNKVKAAPVLWDQGIAKAGKASAVVINSGNANACTGKQGLLDAEKTAEIAASLIGTEKSSVYVCSTGVIGVKLDMAKIGKGIEIPGIKKRHCPCLPSIQINRTILQSITMCGQGKFSITGLSIPLSVCCNQCS